MFRAVSLIIFCIFVMTSVGCAQTQPSNVATKNSIANENSKLDYPSLVTQAEEMGQFTIDSNFEKLIDSTYPVVVEKLGGKEKMLAYLSKDSRQMKADGFSLIGMEVGQPTQLEQVDRQVFAVLPIKMTIMAPDGKFFSESSLVGISDDNGKNWKFISSVDQSRFNSIFPKPGEILRMPEAKQPTKID